MQMTVLLDGASACQEDGVTLEGLLLTRNATHHSMTLADAGGGGGKEEREHHTHTRGRREREFTIECIKSQSENG